MRPTDGRKDAGWLKGGSNGKGALSPARFKTAVSASAPAALGPPRQGLFCALASLAGSLARILWVEHLAPMVRPGSWSGA